MSFSGFSWHTTSVLIGEKRFIYSRKVKWNNGQSKTYALMLGVDRHW